MRTVFLSFMFLYVAVFCFSFTTAFPHALRARNARMPHRRRSNSTSSDTAAKVKASVRLPFSPKGIDFNGGDVMGNGANLYVLWYGNWPESYKSVIRGFLTSLSSGPTGQGSVYAWWNVNALFYDKNGKYLSRNIVLKSEYSISSNYRTVLTESQVTSTISDSVKAHKFLLDVNGIYLFLTSPDIQMTLSDKTKLCGETCGFHDSFLSSGLRYKYAVSARCLSADCNDAHPNGIPGIDGAINIIGHELSETVTDPLGTAWYKASTGDEGADLCNWKFGARKKSKNGQTYNLVGANSAQYLVQNLWDPKNGKCTYYA